MGNFLGLVLLSVVAILKSTLMPHLQVRGGAPDLMLMIIISWALLAPYEEAFTWAFMGGIVQDLLSGVPLGASALGLLIVAFVANQLQTQLYRSNLLIVLSLTLAGSVVLHVVMMGVLAASGYAVNWTYNLAYVTLPTVILNLILVVPIFRVMMGLYNRFSPRIETL
ncbi:MAG: rod shape-determining protein MreD [Anaerolineae bacterium]|nr:rod shape-determining protein MreD [Anaerolineae bacterium]